MTALRCVSLLICAWSAARAATADLQAFDLTEAEQRIRQGGSELALAERLGGITSVVGFVIDRDNRRIVLVGRREPAEPPLSLTDLAVAIRCVVGKGEWPMVSIDPRPDTQRTRKQGIRFEGIENTDFGAQFLAADVTLKLLALGRLKPDGVELESYFDRRVRLVRGGTGMTGGRSRLWFFAVNPALEQRDDTYLIRALRLGVRAEVVGGSESDATPRDVAGDQFAAALTQSFAPLAGIRPELARLQRLYEMIAVAKGLEEARDYVEFWLNRYQIPLQATPTEYDLLSRDTEVKTPAGQKRLEVSGGIEFRILARQLYDGKVSALREAALKSRPAPDALAWAIPFAGWGLSDASEPELARLDAESEAAPGAPLTWHLGESKSGVPAAPPSSSRTAPAAKEVGGINMRIPIGDDAWSQKKR